MEVVFPRIVLAEFNTHRILEGMDEDPVSRFSRNSASSRAIPVAKMLKAVEKNPYIPSEWGANQKGMQAGALLDEEAADEATQEWLMSRDAAVSGAEALLAAGVHKQLTNRLLEPFMWHTVIVTATEWDNFFHLRCHPMAHPDIRIVAEKMRDAMAASTPWALADGQWHLPLIQGDEAAKVKDDWGYWTKVSVGRCARVSYLTHDGKRDPQADIDLHDMLLQNGHMSPFEHVARPATDTDTDKARFELENVNACAGDRWVEPKDQWHGNFRGWVQYRKTIAGESDSLGAR